MRISITAYAAGLSVLLASVAPPAFAQDAPARANLHRRPPLRIESRHPGGSIGNAPIGM
jgi:hypothetical protein